MQSAWKAVLRHKTREIMKRLQQTSQACNQLFNIEQMFWLKNIIKRKKTNFFASTVLGDILAPILDSITALG